MPANKCFLLRLLFPLFFFFICLDREKKILPLKCKHVIVIRFRKIKEKYHQLVSSEISLKHVQDSNFLQVMFEVCLFLVPYFADSSVRKNQNVNDLIFRDKVK